MFLSISAFVIIWLLVDVPPLVSYLRKNALFKMLKWRRIISAFQPRYFCIESLMILRTALPSAYEANPAAGPWAKFVESQNTYIPVLGYISSFGSDAVTLVQNLQINSVMPR
ncbi:MAG: hypothetical protein JWQ42_1012 [Edaphobacter sp.]|nr:hypothetical protein [Edaphobacter sp.]